MSKNNYINKYLLKIPVGKKIMLFVHHSLIFTSLLSTAFLNHSKFNIWTSAPRIALPATLS